MKLIIDIDEEVKNRLCFGVTYKEDIQAVCKALHNGIPLEDIKAEIEDLEPDYGNTGYGFESYYKCQSEVLKIIDKYKAESEE